MILRSIFLTTLLTASGCLQAPKTNLEYGPQVPKEQISTELQKALGVKDSPAFIREEEVVLKEYTQYIRGYPVLKILSTSEVTIVSKIETASQWQVKDVEHLQNYDPNDPTNTPPPIVREDHKCWSKETLAREECEILGLSRKTMGPSSTVETLIQPLASLKQSATEVERTVSFHNLKVKKYKQAPPASVAKDPTCRNIPECLIEITDIDFDRVSWSESPEGKKIHYSFKVSQEVPQMSRILDFCQQGSVPLPQPGQDEKKAPRFLVTFCETVKNFVPGK